MMGLSDGQKSFPIGLAISIQYRSVTDTQPPSHVAVAITLNALAKASSLKMDNNTRIYRVNAIVSAYQNNLFLGFGRVRRMGEQYINISTGGST